MRRAALSDTRPSAPRAEARPPCVRAGRDRRRRARSTAADCRSQRVPAASRRRVVRPTEAMRNRRPRRRFSGHRLHERVLALAAVIVVELLVQHLGGQSGEVGKGVAGTDALCTMTPSAARGERFPAFGIAGRDSVLCFSVPDDRRRYGGSRIRNLRGSRGSRNAHRATDRIPPAEAKCVRLHCGKPHEADHDRDNRDRECEEPADQTVSFIGHDDRHFPICTDCAGTWLCWRKKLCAIG